LICSKRGKPLRNWWGDRTIRDLAFSLGLVATYEEDYRFLSQMAHCTAQGGAWLNLGVAHNELGQASEALVAYRHAVSLRPDLAVAWCNMGNVYGAEGQYPEAVNAYREAIRLGIDDVSLWWRLGLIYAAQGDRSGLAEVHQHLKDLDSSKADEFFRSVVLP